MARVVVHGDRSIPAVDPATVWALVADPSRLGDWSTLQLVGYMGKELPSVGNAFFAKLHVKDPEDAALRFEFVEWVAGNRYLCAMSPGRLADDREIEVRVHSVLEDTGAHTRVQLIHRAEVPRWAMSPYRLAVERRLRRALDSLARRFER